VTQNKGTIAVISAKEDVHIPYVQVHLDKPMLVFDPSTLVDGATLTFKPGSGISHVFYNDKELKNISSIWFRKPWLTRDVVPLRDDFKDYGLETLLRLTQQFYNSFPNALWVSDYYAIQRANDKIRQLTAAQALGFQVPDTLITSDKDAVRVFVKKHGTIIMKTIFPLRKEDEGKMNILFATRISENNLPNLDTLFTSPAIFQQVIDRPICDVRVTVVNDRVFAASIINTSEAIDSSIRDWKVGQFGGKMSYERLELPKDIAEKCINHVQKMGLKFGAIDLVMDRHKKFWFLENNPNGQWGFVERQTGLPIGKAFADLLRS
jgi:glutathione synthase/RimK-type ligase-like ATP-grasp enzyme